MKKLRWKIAQWFENNWWKKYLKNKSPEEYLGWKRNYWKQFLKKIDCQNIEYPAIDIGCGPAGVFITLENSNIALDPLIDKYEENLAIFSSAKYPNTTFQHSTFENFETEEKFNTIFCLNAINHFIDISESFEKLHRICEQEGKLIISIDAHNFSFFKYLFRWLPLDILHPHQYRLEEYQQFLLQYGFEIENSVCLQKGFFFDYWVLVGRKNN